MEMHCIRIGIGILTMHLNGMNITQMGMPRGMIKDIPSRIRENPNIFKMAKVAVTFLNGMRARVGTAKGGVDHKTPPPMAPPIRMGWVGIEKEVPHPKIQGHRIFRGARALGMMGPRARLHKKYFPHTKNQWEVLIKHGGGRM